MKNYAPAIACALAPILCYVVVRPFAEIGINDDWSYIKTAQVLAQTGHIVYNGWGSPMLGWQAYFGALFIWLFGFSFTAVRFATVIETMATAFLLQRTFVRAGVNTWNATLATMTFILSPLCLPLEFTFMADISGVLCIVVCLYMCLRAFQAESEHYAVVWISVAALLNALSGTARQIAWLGALVMVPSTLWLLRRSRRVLVVGCLACIAGAGIVAAEMFWFVRQPYALPMNPIPRRLDLESLELLGEVDLGAAGQLMLLAVPILLMFVASIRLFNRRAAAIFAAALLCFAVPGIALFHAGMLGRCLAPFVEDYMTDATFERLDAIAANGIHLSFAPDSLRVLLTGAVVLGILSFVTCAFAGADRRPAPQHTATAISWQKLGMIIGPFSLAYILILAAIMLRQRFFYDRYLVPLLAICLLVLGRFYQERVRPNLPLVCVFFIAVFGGFSVVATHDIFAQYRGYVSAIGQLRLTGTPATAILGPWEFEAWTETEKVGFVNDHRIRVPKGAWVPPPARSLPSNCDMPSVDFLDWTPAIDPIYAIVLDPTQCGGQLALPAVTYTTRIVQHTNSIYTVRLPAASSN
jgi:hypothetical protein